MWEREGMVFISIFSSFHNIFKGLFHQDHLKTGLFTKGLSLSNEKVMEMTCRFFSEVVGHHE